MGTLKRVVGGCFLLPMLLVGSCFGKMSYDRKHYELPGEVLKSSVAPTQSLSSAMQVAETLDRYVQPRFEILRDKNFGAFRIVYRKHAGLVQLKVDTEEEKTLIANVNVTKRDYAVCLLHCAPVPGYNGHFSTPETPSLQMLYFNQKPIAGSPDWPRYPNDEKATEILPEWETLSKGAIAALPKLMSGKEQRTETPKWSVLMRPVRATKSECLSCHENAKLGDTLGVMVYAVAKEKRPPLE